MVNYVGHVNIAEAAFVVVIMSMASSLPVLRLAENAVARIAALGRGSPVMWWLSILTIGPLLGSFITEPAAMTISALLLRHRFLQSAPEHSLKICNAGSSFRKCVSRRHSESFCSSACSDGGETLELGLFLHATKLWLEGGNCHFSVQFSVFSALSKGTQEIGYRTEDRRANPGPARGSLDDHANPSAFFDLDGSERSLSGIDRFWFSFFPRVRDRHSAAATPNCAAAVPAGRFLSRVAGHSWRMPGMVDRSSAQAADRVAHDDWGHDPNCVQR